MEARFENYLISYFCINNYGKSLAERGSVLQVLGSQNNSYEGTGNPPRHVLTKTTYYRELSNRLKGFSLLDSSLHLHTSQKA